MRKSSLLQFFVFLFPLLLNGQDTLLRVLNGSFERIDSLDVLPRGWVWMGDAASSQPALQPGLDGCTLKAFHGYTYVSLLMSKDSVWGGLGQVLPGNLRRDSTYLISVCLATSKSYERLEVFPDLTRRVFDYPASLAIIAYNRKAGVAELLALTAPIKHREWVSYHIYFRPTHSDYNEIGLFAYINSPKPGQDGHVLVDRLSSIRLVPWSKAHTMRIERGDPIRLLQSTPDRIYLHNPSFEPLFFGASHWYSLLFTGDSRQPIRPEQYKEVERNQGLPPQFSSSASYRNASNGRWFLSLSSNENEVWWAYAQPLNEQLRKGSSYSFSLDLARSKHFKAQAPKGRRTVDYKNPLRFRVWAGTEDQPRQELLAESIPIVHTKWQRYHFTLQPKRGDWTVIVLEGAYLSPIGQPYNGNLLLDNCSTIERVSGNN